MAPGTFYPTRLPRRLLLAHDVDDRSLFLLPPCCQAFPTLRLAFHQAPQPWHPQGSALHEAVLALRAEVSAVPVLMLHSPDQRPKHGDGADGGGGGHQMSVVDLVAEAVSAGAEGCVARRI